jgi:tripartite-type tricarboxylate transporter receptor subunit TctC
MNAKRFHGAALFAVIAGAGLLMSSAPVSADAVSDFYKKSRVKLIIGFPPGGGFNRGGRVVARHIGKYIPGNPKVIAQNMPGGGSLLLMNWLYNKAPKNGTVIGHFHSSAMREAFIGAAGVYFDPRKYYWLGSYLRERAVTFVRADSGIKTIHDVFKKQVIVGATSPRSGGGVYPTILNQVLGTKFKVVVGYGGTGESTLAMERGELQGVGSWSWSQLRDRRAKWLKDNFVNVLVSLSVKPHKDLPNVPTPLQLAKTEEDRQVLESIFAWAELGRPFASPPGTDPARGAALRKAFATMVGKKDFEKDINIASLEVDPVIGKDAEALLAKLYAYPKPVVDRARAVYSEMRRIKIPTAKKKKLSGLKVATVKGKGRKMRITFKDGSGQTWKFKAREKRLNRKTMINGKKGKAGQLKEGMLCAVTYYNKGGMVYSADCKG